MKLGVIVSPAAGWSYTGICDLAQRAEKAGFASFWVSDHFFGGPGGTPDRNCLEAWTLLAALARDTTTIRLGVLVAAVQYRNPALQAKMAARYADGFDLGKHGDGGADLTPEEMAASFRELDAAEGASKRKVRLQRSHWCASTLEADAKPLVDKIRAYAGAGLDQYLCAFPKDRAAEMVERSSEELVPAFA